MQAVADYRRFPYISGPNIPPGEGLDLPSVQERAIDNALGIEVAAFREAFCLPLLENRAAEVREINGQAQPEKRDFSSRDALQAFVSSVEAGIFPRWEVLQIVAAAGAAFLADDRSAGLDKAFSRGKRGRTRADESKFLEIAYYVVFAEMSVPEACQEVIRVRKWPVSPESLADQYRERDPLKLEELARRKLAGFEGSAEIAHIRAAMAESRKHS